MLGMRRVSPREALELMTSQGFAYLDVRSPLEFAEAHPAGAVNVPLQRMHDDELLDDPGFVEAVRARFGPEQPLVVGCATGVRSLRAAALLAAGGFRHLVEQRAGMLGVRDAFGRLTERGWRDEGLPVGQLDDDEEPHDDDAQVGAAQGGSR